MTGKITVFVLSRQDFGALIGGSALVTFRMNPSDTLQKRSVLPMAVAVMFEGGLNLMVL